MIVYYRCTRPLRRRTPFNNVYEKLDFGPCADGLTVAVVNFPLLVVTVGDEPAVQVDLFPPSGLWAMAHLGSRVYRRVVS